MKVSISERILLLLTALISGYYVVDGLEKYSGVVSLYFTIAFGILLIAVILLVLFGFEILNDPIVVIVAALIPLSLSLGLIYKYLHSYHIVYLIFTIVGFLSILLTRYFASKRIATLTLVLVHGISGVIIFLLPIGIYIKGFSSPFFPLVGIGGGLISVFGILLAFLRMGKPILSQDSIYALMPKLLFLATVAFVIGLSLE